ncbi:MAG: protein translocase subunit SecF [Chloroflexi bacterium]|nr:protein translocase subunit SecF [Chloroflexota bacterium]MDE2935816.1 protein translocase subunit SecF [Chloroflexota bacterium]MXW27479.1 protein translocase subunit SecF [Chloroflexota bacterium]MXX66045.1 protein translocase subunit SecF [Chloroflexota bacterium]MXY01059.1 protein translocase subunit SecF [Chloroflexota bacterium]
MIPLIAPRRLLLAISAGLVLVSLALLLAVGVNLGIDFTSGSLARVELGIEGERDAIEDALLDAQIPGAEVQASDGSTYLIRTAELTDAEKDRMEEILSRAYPAFELISFDFVGPVIGAELTRNAALAVAGASIAILLYLTWSFRSIENSFRYGLIAVLTLVHDVLILLGTFAVLGQVMGLQVDSMFVTAALTVAGFSVHDTIVVFDRIRENQARYRGAGFARIVNFSLNQTLDRSLNTSITAIFVLVALLLLGGPTIREFILALLIGIVVGTYSSIFTASQLLVVWDESLAGRLTRLRTRLLNRAG